MIRVQAPDGSIVEFPDGTPDDVMSNAMRRTFGSPSQESSPQQPPQAQQPSGWQDVAGSIGAGLARGAAGLVGLPGTISDIGQGYMDQAVGALTGRQPQPRQNPLSGQSLIGAMSRATGGATDYRGQYPGAGFVEAAAEAVPGAVVLGPAGLMANAAYGALSGAAGEALARGAQSLGFGETGQGVARFVGGMAAPLAASRAITPFRMTPEQQATNQTLRSEGVQQTAGQQTGSRNLMAAESQLGGSATQRLTEAQKEQFTQAALRRVGIEGERATPDVLRKGLDDLGQRFDDLASSTTIRADQTMQQQLAEAVAGYADNVSAGDFSRSVANTAADIAAKAEKNGGILTGRQYQNIRSAIGRQSRTANPTTAGALRDVQGALDDAVSRSMPPETLPAWQQTRQQYRDFLTIEKAATRAGADSAEGIISPGALRQAARSTEGTRSAALGKGSFDDLARAGVSGMKSFPDSGTASRQFWQNLGGGLSAMGGAGGYMLGDVAGAIPGAIAGAALPRMAGSALMSTPAQSYLANQLVNPLNAREAASLGLIDALTNQRRK